MAVRPGRYRHYQGGFYRVVGVAVHSETLEELVVYHQLQSSPQFPANQLFVRPQVMFEETVAVDGQTQPRFIWIAEE